MESLKRDGRGSGTEVAFELRPHRETQGGLEAGRAAGAGLPRAPPRSLPPRQAHPRRPPDLPASPAEITPISPEHQACALGLSLFPELVRGVRAARAVTVSTAAAAQDPGAGAGPADREGSRAGVSAGQSLRHK